METLIPKAFSFEVGLYASRWVIVNEPMITKVMLCNSSSNIGVLLPRDIKFPTVPVVYSYKSFVSYIFSERITVINLRGHF